MLEVLTDLTTRFKDLWEALSARNNPAHPPHNVLEWLGGRSVPSSFVTLVLGFLAALTLAPYLGGRSISVFGSSPVSIPTLDAGWLWSLVLATPAAWVLIIARVIHASSLRIFAIIGCAGAISFASVVLHKTYPPLSLRAMTPNFDRSFSVDFLKAHRTWDIAHERVSEQDRYCYFRSSALDLSAPTEIRGDDRPLVSGCALRIDRVEVGAHGTAQLRGETSLDLEVYAGSGGLLPMTTACEPATSIQEITKRPDAAIEGRIVIVIDPSEQSDEGSIRLKVVYDFAGDSTSAVPALRAVKALRRSDLLVGENIPELQVSGWTLEYKLCSVRLFEITVRVTGRMGCGYWF